MNSPLLAIDEEMLATVPPGAVKKLLEASVMLASSLDVCDILRRTIESATALLRLDTGAVYTLDRKTLVLGGTVPPLPDDFPDKLRRAPLRDHATIARALAAGKPVVIEDSTVAELTPAEQAVVDARDLRSILYMPLVIREDALGIFIVGSSGGHYHHFSEADIDLGRALAALAAAAIANARLLEETRNAVEKLTRAYDSTIAGWSRVLDLRDHETDEHSTRVTALTVEMARKMRVEEAAIVNLRRGALLHDIGKMGVPDAILNKAGPLNAEERAIIETHPTLAHEILSAIDFLKPTLDIPHAHHEKWDGSGYPLGLKGSEIPLAARLFAIVDVYDALTSDRPYRSAWSREKAVEYIRNQSGKHFDPRVVELFLETVTAWN